MEKIEPTFSGITDNIENPYLPSRAHLIENDAPSFSTPKTFEFSGRISLARYWLIHTIFVMWIPILLVAFFILGLRQQPLVLLIVATAIFIPSALLSISLVMRRARDLNWSAGWGIAAMLIPFIGWLIYLPLTILPGKENANKYGAPNEPFTTTGNILVGLLVALSFTASAAIPLYLFQGEPKPIYDLIFNYIMKIQE